MTDAAQTAGVPGRGGAASPRASELYHAALERPASERAAFLHDACGADEALRSEVASLLEYADASTGFMEPTPASDLVGQSIGPYRVVATLGAGGMGVVYRARDERLGRDVALKVLPPHWASDPDRRARLDREARALATLNHPHIAAIYGLEESGPVRALVLELVEGQPLSEVVAKGPLPIASSLAIARQIADALGAAHAKGIVHRDLKPGNIMWCDGEREAPTVKLLDFGLAKLAPQASPASDATALASGQTGTATIVGTPAYMSPEQARGAPVDKRTDIWAFGCVLFEMLTGRPAFERDTVTDTLAAIVTAEPDWQALPAGTPPAAVALLRWCLNKDLPARLHDIADARPALTPADSSHIVEAVQPSRRRAAMLAGAVVLAAAIAAVAWAAWPRTPILTSRDTIVLADFANTTGDAAFDGTLRHAMATALEQSPFLNILPDERVDDVLRLMNRGQDEPVTRAIARDICQRENLKAFVAGSVAQLGSQYVIALEAVNGQTGEVLAREQGESDQKERVLTALGQVASQLRKRLGESLASIRANDLPIERVTTSSLEAYRAYVDGADFQRRSRNQEAVAALKRAVDLDPNFASAHLVLSFAYLNMNQARPGDAHLQRAFELRDRASERERLAITGGYARITNDLDQGLEAWEQLKQLEPAVSRPHTNSSSVYRLLGEFEKSVDAARESVRVRPDAANGIGNLVASLERLNQFVEAKTAAQDAIGRGLDSWQMRGTLFRIGIATGDLQLANDQVKWADGKPEERQAIAAQIGAAAVAGQLRESTKLRHRAVSLAERAGDNTTATHAAGTAFDLAVTGRCAEALATSASIPVTARGSTTGFVLGVCGDEAGAKATAARLVQAYPRGTLENNLHAPLVNAAAALPKMPDQALKLLEIPRKFDRVSSFRTQYLRGLAYLRLSRGADAAVQFQYIRDHRGEDALSILYPLASVGLARAATHMGDTAKARAAYETFLKMWKDADPDIPILREARQEVARLK